MRQMTRKVILSLVCLAMVAWQAAAAGVQQRITSVLSVTFPAEPRATHVDDQLNYLYQTDTCAWLAQAKQYEENGQVHDSATLASFYEGMAKGILRAAKGTETRRSNININGLRAMEIEYVKGDQRSLPATVCSRALKVNGEIVILSFTAPTERYDRLAGERNKFFNSMVLDKDSTLNQYTDAVPAAPARAADSTAISPADTTSKAIPTQAPVSFMQSHAGSVIKMFGLLVLVCALIYGFAVYTRRKG